MAIYKVDFRINASGSVFVEASSKDAAEAVARADEAKLVKGCAIIENDVDVEAISEVLDVPSLDETVRHAGN